MREERVARPRREHAHEAKPETDPEGEHPVSPVLLLQRQAGNRAVGSLLARDAAGPGEREKPTLNLPDPVGALPVLSWRPEGSQGMVVSVPSSGKAPELQKLAQDGQFLGDVTLTTWGIVYTIHKAVIANVTIHEDVVQVTIDGDLSQEQPKKDDDRPGAVGNSP
jgi:hypothetical protein